MTEYYINVAILCNKASVANDELRNLSTGRPPKKGRDLALNPVLWGKNYTIATQRGYSHADALHFADALDRSAGVLIRRV